MATDPVRDPIYWLVYGLPWPVSGPEYRESAVAFAPTVVARSHAPTPVTDILDLADAYQRETGWRVMFFSDVTKCLDGIGSSWDAMGIDWEAAFEYITERLSPPQLYLHLNQLAHLIVCDASRNGLTVIDAEDGTASTVSRHQREQVRSAIEQMITRDWPGYIDHIRETGRLHQAPR